MEIERIEAWLPWWQTFAAGGKDLSPCYAPYYVQLLEAYLKRDAVFLGVKKGKKVLALIPLFLQDGPAGRVANSLPYYGSYGGCLADPELSVDERRQVKGSLLSGLVEWARAETIRALIIINHPFEEDADLYRSTLNPELQEHRIGQVLRLPTGPAEEALEELLKMHKKGRNMVRKGLRSTRVREENTPAALDFLYTTHRENLEAIGGRWKERRLFQLVFERLLPREQYMLHVGYVDDKPAAALLTLRFGGVVEYFTPVIQEPYRSTQALSAVILHAMLEAAVSGYRWWNWGGTWETQKSLYRFKAKWGGEDRPYLYHIKLFCDSADLSALGMKGLLEAYPFFYTIPFQLAQPVIDGAGEGVERSDGIR